MVPATRTGRPNLDSNSSGTVRNPFLRTLGAMKYRTMIPQKVPPKNRIPASGPLLKMKFAPPMIEPEPTKVASRVPARTQVGRDLPARTKSSPSFMAEARPNHAAMAIMIAT